MSIAAWFEFYPRGSRDAFCIARVIYTGIVLEVYIAGASVPLFSAKLSIFPENHIKRGSDFSQNGCWVKASQIIRIFCGANITATLRHISEFAYFSYYSLYFLLPSIPKLKTQFVKYCVNQTNRWRSYLLLMVSFVLLNDFLELRRFKSRSDRYDKFIFPHFMLLKIADHNHLDCDFHF